LFKKFSEENDIRPKTPEPEIPVTSRELEVLKLVTKGYNNGEIGERLFISPHTVDSHRRNLLRKLNLHNAVELTTYAFENNLLE